MPSIQKLLIANRGEIALRVACTARRMGIATVAVYSQADRNADFVKACDEAVCIGAAPARSSYLDIDKVIAAALSTGADAVHPGYGFLSENEQFASACEQAGLIFVGPPASAIAAMGSKAAAKALMQAAQVPLVPGYHGDDQSAAVLHAHADAMGYPVLLKAASGGGGKGMRVVHESADFTSALLSCQREALSSFGDARVLIERYLTQARHIEVQVFADQQGNCVHLFERDCSVQRRHQKVLEEAPAPGLSLAMRAAMGAAAVAAAKAVSYVGAGTLEFIVEPDGRFYFMEMNTRLQVEHPVTEMITGLDLVALQLKVAQGEPLPFGQDELSINGHSVEVRVYAENPAQDFLPSMGRLAHLSYPPSGQFKVNQNPLRDDVFYSGQPFALRIDGGVKSGDEVTGYYDPMISKIITWGPTRDAALARLQTALSNTRIVGVHSNIAFLKRLIQDTDFVAGTLDTALISRRRDSLFPAPVLNYKAVAVALLAIELGRPGAQGRATSESADPWQSLKNWRLAGEVTHQRELAFNGENVTCSWQISAGQSAGFAVGDDQKMQHLRWNAPVFLSELAFEVNCELNDEYLSAGVVWQSDQLHVFVQGEHHVLNWLDPLKKAGEQQVAAGGLTAPMPGKVIAVMVKAGDTVKKGQPLLVMEAMKMEHTLQAPQDGVITACHFNVGDQVSEGVAMLEFQ